MTGRLPSTVAVASVTAVFSLTPCGGALQAQESAGPCRIPRSASCSFVGAAYAPPTGLGVGGSGWAADILPEAPPKETVRPPVAFAASLALPGGGQWLQGQGRGYVYLGLEILGWAAFIAGRHDGGVLRNRYRDLAWNVARSHESPRMEPDWAYFEALSHFRSSGSWDADQESPGIQPETDTTTFNGSVWALARELYLPPGGNEASDSTDYSRALEYYRSHGYPSELGWDWSGDPTSQVRYQSLIVRSDDAYRRATIVLALVVTNHVLSAVDGFLSARMAQTPGAAPHHLHLGATPGRSGRPRWSFAFRLGSGP